MQDAMCSLHLATLAHIHAARAHCFHVGRKLADTSLQAVDSHRAALNICTAIQNFTELCGYTSKPV